MSRCTKHLDPAKCEEVAAQLLASADDRYALSTELGDAVWNHVAHLHGVRVFEEFLDRFDPCDCWKHGGPPLPTIERSAALWHVRVRRGRTAAEILERDGRLHLLCPVEAEWFVAMREARLSLFHVAFADGEAARLRDVFDSRRFALETPLDRTFLGLEGGEHVFTRIVTFRGRHFILSEDSPVNVFDAAGVRRIEREVKRTCARSKHRHASFPFTLFATVDAILQEDWERELAQYEAGFPEENSVDGA